ncbi:hypothetical protein JVU11DRAFT_8377 [Chiua virens]|nr:hypothetical protein JVU11DRAFT_8377 [Chiua virens]
MDLQLDESCFARAFACAPIYDPILSSLSLHALIQVALTCRVAYHAVANYKSRAFNINRHLSRYFLDPVAFRSLQAKTNTLISGSNALQFLDRSFYPESDLDLYTHPGHTFELAQFLVQVERYTFVPTGHQPTDWRTAIPEKWDGTQKRVRMEWDEDEPLEYPLKGITGVFTFQKPSPSEGTLKVQVIEAAASPVEAILHFHSTCVMNLISSDAAYALYPMATLVERTGLGMPRGASAHEAIAKYIARGWRIYFSPRPSDLAYSSDPPFLLDQPRWVGDKHTFVIPFDQNGVQPRPTLSPGSEPLTFDPVRCYGWRLGSPFYVSQGNYACQTHTVHSTVFRYNYAFPDHKGRTRTHRLGGEAGQVLSSVRPGRALDVVGRVCCRHVVRDVDACC